MDARKLYIYICIGILLTFRKITNSTRYRVEDLLLYMRETFVNDHVDSMPTKCQVFDVNRLYDIYLMVKIKEKTATLLSIV